DFYRLCRRFRVSVQEMPLAVSGFYYRVMGRDFIAVDSRLAGPQKLAVLFHELGHFLFHAPDSGETANFHGVGRRTRKECEADIFALCAVIPLARLISHDAAHPIDDDLPADLLKKRLEIYPLYGI